MEEKMFGNGLKVSLGQSKKKIRGRYFGVFLIIAYIFLMLLQNYKSDKYGEDYDQIICRQTINSHIVKYATLGVGLGLGVSLVVASNVAMFTSVIVVFGILNGIAGSFIAHGSFNVCDDGSGKSLIQKIQ